MVEEDPTAALRSLEELCPGCPPRPAANALAFVMRDRGLQMQPARAFLAGLPPGEAAALEEDVRAAKAEYSARLRAYCGRKGAGGVVGSSQSQDQQQQQQQQEQQVLAMTTAVRGGGGGGGGGKTKKRAQPSSPIMLCI